MPQYGINFYICRSGQNWGVDSRVPLPAARREGKNDKKDQEMK